METGSTDDTASGSEISCPNAAIAETASDRIIVILDLQDLKKIFLIN